MTDQIYEQLKEKLWQPPTDKYKQPLNAIAQARLFASLLIDILDEDFLPFSAFNHEQDYYAQVADGNQYRIPRGAGKRLITAMGISNTGQLRHIRRLLRLPRIVWTIADDLNWSGNFILKNIIADNDIETIHNAIHHTIHHTLKEGLPESFLDDYLYLLEQHEATKISKFKLSFSDIHKTTLAKLRKQVFRLDKTEKEKAVDYIEHLIESLKSK